jgi:hypothetical protein
MSRKHPAWIGSNRYIHALYALVKGIKRDLPRYQQPLAIAGLRCNSMNASWLIAEAA